MNGKRGNIKTAISTLEHSMRVNLGLDHEVNHNPNMTKHNLYFTTENNSLSESSNEELFKSISEAIVNQNDSELSKEEQDKKNELNRLKAAYRVKLKGYKGSEEAKALFKEMAETDEPETVQDKLKHFDSLGESRAKQKVKSINSYIETLSELKKFKPSPKTGSNMKTIMQEQLFKIPVRNEVAQSDVSRKDYAEIALKFNQLMNPNHKIEGIAIHADEMVCDESDPKKKYGLHAHVFINGRDKFGNDNIREVQLEFCKEYCKKNSPDEFKKYNEHHEAVREILNNKLASLESTGNQRVREEMKLKNELHSADGQFFGRVYQQSMLHFFNENLLHEKKLNAEFHYESRTNVFLKRDQGRRHNERKYNMSNFVEEKYQEKKLSLELKYKEKVKIKEELLNDLDSRYEERLKQYNSDLASKREQNKSIINSQKEELSKVKNERDSVKNELNEAKSDLKEIYSKFEAELKSISTKIINAFIKHRDGLSSNGVTKENAETKVAQEIDEIQGFTIGNTETKKDGEFLTKVINGTTKGLDDKLGTKVAKKRKTGLTI